jgi:ribonuclease Z
MVQSMSMNGREAPLEVYGPRGVEQLVSELLSLGYFTPGFAVKAKEIPSGGEVDCGEYVVRAFEAVHTVPATSYVLEEKDRPGRFDVERAEALGVPTGPMYSRLQEGETVHIGDRTIRPEDVLGPPRRGRKVVYTGDTMPHEALVDIAHHADVLIHDATSDAALEEKANRYGHSSSRQAAEVAREAEVGLLVLTHLSPRYEDATTILEDAKKVFENVRVAEDFMEVEVPFPDRS